MLSVIAFPAKKNRQKQVFRIKGIITPQNFDQTRKLEGIYFKNKHHTKVYFQT
jgi:hypothetical protein